MNLVLKLYPDADMAFIFDGNRCINMGNDWDFHSGCSGTSMTFEDGTVVDFENEWTDDIRGPAAVMKMIDEKLDTKHTVEYIEDDEYESLMG